MANGIKYRTRRSTRPQRRKRRSDFSGFIALGLMTAGAAGYYGADLVPDLKLLRPLPPRTVASTIVGRASVIDGDTIEIHGERIRFNGIDAPESSQLCSDSRGKSYRCGAKAAEALQDFLAASSPTRCEFIERDQYGRFVGDCFRTDGVNVQQWLVRNGHAMDWPRYSNGAYSADQQAAQTERRGIWAGDFQPPWEWRAAQRRSREPSIVPLMGGSTSGACKIKGNVSSKGERIYHMPGQEYYEQTKISPSQGERWFCSEAEAREAGWRRSRK